MDTSVTLPPLPMESIDLRLCVVSVTLSTPNPDRAGDVIPPTAWQLENHSKIPIALFDHNRDLPVGLFENPNKEYTLKVVDGILRGEIWFNQKCFRAMEVFDLISQGIIRGASPGLRPLKFSDNKTGGKLIESAELIEGSVTLIPTNPEAVVNWIQKARSKKFDAAIIKSFDPVVKQFNQRAKSVAVENDPPKDDDELPFGAKALNTVHSGILALKSVIAGVAKKQESPAVKEYLKELEEEVDEMAGRCSDTYTKEYPDAPELKESGEDSIPIEDVKRLKDYEKGFKDLKAVVKNLQRENEGYRRQLESKK